MKEEQNIYTITLTEDQLQEIAEALEFTSRFTCGQIGQTYFPNGLKSILWKKHKDNWQNMNDSIDAASNFMKLAMHPEISVRSNYGIGKFDYADTLYDMYKAIRHVLWKDRGGDEHSVHSHLHPVTNNEQLKIEKLTDE